MDATAEQLRALFPVPDTEVAAPVVRNPTRYPGVTSESVEALLECMRDNHHRHHIFFNDKGFHNHATHHLLAIFAMGADATLLKAAYQTHVVYQRSAFEPPEVTETKEKPTSVGIINETNWKEHLGNDKYYQAYAAFFTTLLLEKGKTVQSVLEEYVFSRDANIVPGKTGEKPHMLARYHGGFLHPLIHIGYGTEFGLPGMVVEGLAQAAAHAAWALPFYPDELWTPSLTSQLGALALAPAPPADEHALAVLGRVAGDPELAPERVGMPYSTRELGPQPGLALFKVVEVAAARLGTHADAWLQGVRPERGALRRKFAELAWAVTLIYGVGGWAGRDKGGDEQGAFNGDFFNMHLVTSSLMVLSQLNTLSLPSALLLLRTYFTNVLAVYVSRGRPPLPIAAFYAAVPAAPAPPSLEVTPAAATLPPAGTPNAWLALVQSTLVHPDEHLCKAQRALLHYAEAYGATPAGAFGGIRELAGADVLDGTLFVRVAGLTAGRLGWMREGEGRRKWDFAGFYPETAKGAQV